MATVRPFEVLDASSVLLITTRNRDVLPRGTQRLDVDQMSIEEAVQLLGAGLGSNEGDFEALSRLLGEWPILLGLANGQLRRMARHGVSVDEALKRVENRLESKGLSAFDRRDAEARADAVKLTMEAGFESGLLSLDDEERYVSLAVFPKDTDIPLVVLAPYWDLAFDDAFDVLERFFDFSLLQYFDGSEAVLRLHGVFHRYLIDLVGSQEDRLAALHREFLGVHRPVSGRWVDLDPEERYLWHHLAHHLVGAGETEFLVSQLFDF